MGEARSVAIIIHDDQNYPARMMAPSQYDRDCLCMCFLTPCSEDSAPRDSARAAVRPDGFDLAKVGQLLQRRHGCQARPAEQLVGRWQSVDAVHISWCVGGIMGSLLLYGILQVIERPPPPPDPSPRGSCNAARSYEPSTAVLHVIVTMRRQKHACSPDDC